MLRVQLRACGKRVFLFFGQGEENYLYSLVRMTLEQLPKLVQDDQEVGTGRGGAM